ncbi:MAG TPA: acyltransferase [Steroidobacteraceae bacterium]|jgi:peptidoglycan/LPS O-acetylase OafA/YrhL
MGTWRLVLAWLVVANHTPGLKEISTNLEIGKVAVATFFFISGFLMPLTYDSHYRGYGAAVGARKFYANRFLRIFPIYWLSLGLTLLAVFAYGPMLMEHATSPGELHQVRTYASNLLLLGLNQTHLWHGDFRFNPPAWTLDVELQYYLLVPLIILMTNFSGRLGAAVLAMFGSIGLYLCFRPVGVLDVDRSLIEWSFFFFLGYGFYFSPALQKVALRKALLGVLCLALILIACVSRHQNVAILTVTLACIVVSSYLLVLQQNRAFGSWDRLLGDLSYPTYITHWLCIQLIFRWLGNTLDFPPKSKFFVLLAINVVGSTLVAYASMRIVGDPIEAFRRRIRDGRRPTVAPE